MIYVLIVALVLLGLLYFSCAYIIQRVVESKNPGIYSDVSRIRRVGIMLLLPVLTVSMAGIEALSKPGKKPKKQEAP